MSSRVEIQASGFAPIPYWLADAVSDTAIRVFMTLWRYANYDSARSATRGQVVNIDVWPSLEEIGQRAAGPPSSDGERKPLSERTVTRAIAELRTVGAVKVIRRGGTGSTGRAVSNVYRLTIDERMAAVHRGIDPDFPDHQMSPNMASSQMSPTVASSTESMSPNLSVDVATVGDLTKEENQETPPTPPPSAGGTTSVTRESIDTVLNAYLDALGPDAKRDRKIDESRRGRIKRKLQAGYALEDLVDAVRGWRHDPWANGEKDGTRKAGLDIVLKNAEWIDRFAELERAHRKARGEGKGQATRTWQAVLAGAHQWRRSRDDVTGGGGGTDLALDLVTHWAELVTDLRRHGLPVEPGPGGARILAAYDSDPARGSLEATLVPAVIDPAGDLAAVAQGLEAAITRAVQAAGQGRAA